MSTLVFVSSISCSTKPIFEELIDCVPILDVIMEVGDAIWIPRYYPHQAISLTPRLSVSFPFNDTENTAHKDHFEDRNWVTL